VVLRPDILERVRRDFAGQDFVAAVALLEAHSNAGQDRLMRCVVHLSSGALDKLAHYLQVAGTDERDVVFWAEYEGDRHVRDFSRSFQDA